MTMEEGDGLKEELDPDSYDQLMYTQNVETIELFSSHVMPVKAGSAHTGECINITVQALWTEDGSLPQGLTVQNTYTKLRQGSKKSSHGGKEQYCILTEPSGRKPQWPGQ